MGTFFQEYHRDAHLRHLYDDPLCHRGGGRHHPSCGAHDVSRHHISRNAGHHGRGLLYSVRVCRLACLCRRSGHRVHGRGPCRLCVLCRGSRPRVGTDGTSLRGARNALDKKKEETGGQRLVSKIDNFWVCLRYGCIAGGLNSAELASWKEGGKTGGGMVQGQRDGKWGSCTMKIGSLSAGKTKKLTVVVWHFFLGERQE